MGIWIRSQDKKSLIQCKNLHIGILIVKGYAILDGIGNLVLGSYETEERAIEMIDEIQNKILHSQDIEFTKSGFSCNNGVLFYQMPEK